MVRLARLERAAEALGISLGTLAPTVPHAGESHGGRILLRRDLSEREQAATLAHELAHELLHQAPRDEASDAIAPTQRRPMPAAKNAKAAKSLRETEAEATAYVVMRALGLPSKAPTYIAWQGGSGHLVLSSLGRIHKAARRILEAAGIDPLLQPPSPRQKGPHVPRK